MTTDLWRKHDIDAVGGTVLIVVALVGYVLAIHGPLNDSLNYDDVRRQRDEMSVTTASLRAKIAVLERQIEETTEQLRHATSKLPTSQAVDDLVSRLHKIASRCGLVITRLQPMDVIKHEDYEISRFIVEGNATFPAIHRWLAAVESEARYLDVTNFSILATKEKEKSGGTICRFECSQRLYFEPSGETMTALAKQP